MPNTVELNLSDTNCCDDNNDGYNDYWCLNCLDGDCPNGGYEFIGDGHEIPNYVGCDIDSIFSAGYGALNVNGQLKSTSSAENYITQSDDNNPVPQFPMYCHQCADASQPSTDEQYKMGCPCLQGYSIQDCIDGNLDPLNCSPTCCHWHNGQPDGFDGDYSVWYSDFYGGHTFLIDEDDWFGGTNTSPDIIYPFVDMVGRNIWGGTQYKEPKEENNSPACPVWRAVNDDGDDIPFVHDSYLQFGGGWEYSGGDNCPENWNEGSLQDYEKFVSGTGFNAPSYNCPPYQGLVDGSWWNADGESWEIPDQSGAGIPIGTTPCLARRFKTSYESYTKDDRFQVIQLPWPKGARDEIEAYKRISCYFNCINGGVCFDPSDAPNPNDNTEIRNRILDLSNIPSQIGNETNGVWNTVGGYGWLNGVAIGDDCGSDTNCSNLWTYSDELQQWVSDGVYKDIIELSCAKRFLGYEAEQHWVLFDTGAIGMDGYELDAPSFGDRIRHTDGGGDGIGDSWETVGDDDYPNFTNGTMYSATDGENWISSKATKCVAYNYPACPVRLDKKQIDLHWHPEASDRNAEWEDEVKQRLLWSWWTRPTSSVCGWIWKC